MLPHEDNFFVCDKIWSELSCVNLSIYFTCGIDTTILKKYLHRLLILRAHRILPDKNSSFPFVQLTTPNFTIPMPHFPIPNSIPNPTLNSRFSILFTTIHFWFQIPNSRWWVFSLLSLLFCRLSSLFLKSLISDISQHFVRRRTKQPVLALSNRWFSTSKLRLPWGPWAEKYYLCRLSPYFETWVMSFETNGVWGRGERAYSRGY